MLTLPLEPTDDRAKPIFKDAASCTKWLSQLQLTHIQQAHSLLLTQLDESNRFPMSGLERLNTLELLRETIGFVQDDYAKKLIAKPLPLNDSELMVFLSIVQLWQALVLGYQRCLQAYMGGDKQLAKHGALLCQRCLLYSGLAIFEYLRAGYEFNAKLWHQLHALYAFAEEQGLQQAEVADKLSVMQPKSSCHSIYVKTLLACYAHPAELTRSQLQLLDHWLAMWSNTIAIERSFTVSAGDAQPLAVDLTGTLGLQVAKRVTHSNNMRYLAMVPLSKLLRVKTILLQQGKSPRSLELGDRNSNDCIEFLTFLHRYWCEDQNMRISERKPVAHQAKLCYKLEGIYAYISGRPFGQADGGAGMTSAARQQIETYGHVLQKAPDVEFREMGFPLETWNLENESILGARLSREDSIGGRLNCNQLIALRPSDANFFILGVISWASVALTGKLHIGVRYQPGAPEAVSIKKLGTNLPVAQKYVPAFLLPAIAAINTPPSLVIPRDWFESGHLVEMVVAGKDKQTIKMGFSVERGVDYERISFTPVEDVV